MKTHRGFTLIELMIVVAIIAILAAIAISQYQDYVAKAQLSEAFSIADGLKTKVIESFIQDADCPTNGTKGIPLSTSLSGKYVAQSVAAGTSTPQGGCTLAITFKGTGSASTAISSKTVTFTLTGVQSGPARWICTTAIDARYLPETCR